MTGINERIEREFEKNLDSVRELSHRINASPELALEEHETSAAIIATLHDRGGFTVKERVARLPTAFVASAGSGEFVFGLCAEMDALPGIGHHPLIAQVSGYGHSPRGR